MRLLLTTIFLSTLLFGATVSAHDVLVVQSFRATPYDEVLIGFKELCGAETKTVKVSDRDGFDMERLVREERPSMILAIGTAALKEAVKVGQIPVVYLMVLNPDNAVGERDNVTGVNMLIPPEKFLNVMERLDLPKLKVGILYDPANSGALLKRIQSSARSRGIEIRAKEIGKANEVPEALARLSGSINLFWLLPDPTVVTGETIEFILLFAQQKKLPVVTFAGKYVEMGALLSLNIDCIDMGRQAGEIANRILHGESADDIPAVEARNSLLKVNHKVASKLGLGLGTLYSSPLANPRPIIR